MNTESVCVQELDLEGHVDGGEERLQECHYSPGTMLSSTLRSVHITIASMHSWKISRPLIHMVGAFKYLLTCLAVVCRL